MRIKKRLIISNSLVVIIPFIITLISAYLFIFISSQMFNSDVSYDNFRKLTSIRTEVLNIASSISKHDQQYSNKDEISNYLEQRLEPLNGKYIVTYNNEIIFYSRDLSKFEANNCVKEAESEAGQSMISLDDEPYMVQLAEVTYKTGGSGSIILLAPATQKMNMFTIFVIFIISIFIVSFIIVNALISLLLSERIVKPVEELKKAAAEISKGNLEQAIAAFGDEEISGLCSDFERMRVQLKDSVKMREKYDDDRKMLISSISHDLKTPITSIKGYVEGILDNIANTEEKRRFYLNTIYSKAENIDAMIEDLLLYSKLDLNQIPFNFETTNIKEFFKYCIYEVEPELKKSNIGIELKSELKLDTYVNVDLDRMKRVILNIIDNSRKYMNKEAGKIEIRLRETSLSVIIEIKDNGVGIDKEQINNIFERFYRADAARTETKGSGLGLAIAKQIVEGHNGKIWAISHEASGISILISLKKTNRRQ